MLEKVQNVKWGIFPPRFAGSQVYYKDIVVFAVDKDKVIGAERFDLDGNSVPISTLDIEFNPKMVTNFKEIQHPGDNIMDNIVRTSWLFNSKEEAFIQKVILLAHIRGYFYKKQKEDRNYFDTKIPSIIDEKLDILKNKYPEVML